MGLFHGGPGQSFHSFHSSDLNLQRRSCVSHYTPPCGSAPPLPSLTCIAGNLALVKLTSSLNYANKAVVICICTAWWYVELGAGVARKIVGEGESTHVAGAANCRTLAVKVLASTADIYA